VHHLATNRKLLERQSGHFREDLFLSLHVRR
jgi:hypothetical protein